MKPGLSEDDFFSLLQDVFKDAEMAFAVFHSYEELNRLAVHDRDVSNALQPDAYFWNVCRVSLQTTLFMALGRVFDTASDARSLPRLLNITIGNPQFFSRASLGARKMVDGQKTQSRNVVMAKAWIPAGPTDLQFLKDELKPLAEHFKEIYRPLRHSIYAHRLMSDEQAGEELFPLTNRQILRAMVNGAYDVVHAIQDLYVGGVKPSIGSLDVEREAKRASGSVGSLLRKLVY